MKRIVAAVVVTCSGASFADDSPSSPAEEKEIVVVASRHEEPASAATSAVRTFGPDDFERLRPTAVADVLREVPGAYVSPDGPTGQFTRVFLRGAASNQTLVLVDGIPQNDATAGGLFDFGDLGMTGVERVEVLRGSYSVLYGSEAIGGVVNVTTRRGRGEMTGYARALLGSFHTRRGEAGVSVGDERFDFAFALADSATDGDRDREEFGEHDAVSRFGFALSDTLRVDASVRGAVSRVQSPYDFASSGVLPEDENSGRRRETLSGGATLTWDAAEWLTVRATGSVFNVKSYFDNGPDGPELVDPDFTPNSGDEFTVVRDELVSRNVCTDLRGRLEATATVLRQTGASWKQGLGAEVTAGGEYLDQKSLSVSTSPDFGAATSSTSRADDVTRTKSVFVQAQLRLPETAPASDAAGPRLLGNEIVTIGVRHDDHSVFGSENSPYVGARADLFDTTLRASYGEGFRAPKPSELFDPFVGNAALGAETSKSLDVGVSRSFLDGTLTAGVTWFRLRVDGLIAYDASATSPSRPFGQLTNFSRTETTGFEYEGAARLGAGFTLRGSFTAQNPRDRDTGLPLANRARRFGSAGLSWEKGAWLVSLDGSFSGSNGNQGGEFTAPDHDARQHPGRRNLVDLSVRWQATDDLSVFGGVRNLLDDAWVATPNSPAGTGIGVYLGAEWGF